MAGGHLGPLLCWAVVFADIGTSVYYVPGILYGHFGSRSAIFVGMTLVVFVLLTLKYAEVAWRYPEGGGVVTVASRALHPFAGLLGGLFIVVDYYLTAALSALSGFIYIAVVAPGLAPKVIGATVIALFVLGILNFLGIKESALVSAVFATAAGAGQLLVVIAVALHLGPAGIVQSFRDLAHGPGLSGIGVLTGYSAAFLAFSGLESIAQVAPAMRIPRRRVAYRSMAAVVATIAVTSPLLTLWSTTQLGPKDDPNQFISLLGAHVAGPVLGDYVAVSGALLLVFASNTAIIGAYHVFLALTRMGFLPRPVEVRNRWRQTPHIAIALAVVIPIAVVVLTAGNVDLLGDLYAFGLLGAFVLTSLGLDIVRWHERPSGARQWLSFGAGAVTTAAVATAWMTNLVAKPLATAFGGGLTIAGLVVGGLTFAYVRRRRPVVFPIVHRPGRPVMHLTGALRLPRAEVLAILPTDPDAARALISSAAQRCDGKAVVFVYRGEPPARAEAVRAVDDPYLKDFRAQDAFSRAEALTRNSIPDRRYVYVPGDLPREAMGRVWRELMPGETIVVDGEQDVLPAIALDRVLVRAVDGVRILRLVSRKAAA